MRSKPAQPAQPKKMGRPRKEWSVPEFEKLCSIIATEDEICGWFDISHDTLVRRCHEEYNDTFANVYKRLSANGKISVRRMQLQVANKGNVGMLIWLGKQMLGQKDKSEQTIDSKENLVIVVDDPEKKTKRK